MMSKCNRSHTQFLSSHFLEAIKESQSKHRNYSLKMDESSSTQTSCQFFKPKIDKNKFNSFKNIKDRKIKEKNALIPLQTHEKKLYNKIFKIQVQSLDEAASIKSLNSESVNDEDLRSEESMIVVRGHDWKENPEKVQNFLLQQRYYEKQNEEMKILNHRSINLAIFTKIGILVHFEVFPSQSSTLLFLKKLQTINDSSILSLYQVKRLAHSYLIAFYQPYNMSFFHYLTSLKTINILELILYLVDLLKIIIFLQKQQMNAQIKIQNLVLVNRNLKLKIISKCSTQISYIQECGKIGQQILNLVEHKANKKRRIQEIRSIFDEIQQKQIEQIELKLKLLKYA